MWVAHSTTVLGTPMNVLQCLLLCTLHINHLLEWLHVAVWFSCPCIPDSNASSITPDNSTCNTCDARLPLQISLSNLFFNPAFHIIWCMNYQFPRKCNFCFHTKMAGGFACWVPWNYDWEESVSCLIFCEPVNSSPVTFLLTSSFLQVKLHFFIAAQIAKVTQPIWIAFAG